MINQVGQPLTGDCFYTASKVGKTGITVTANVRDPDDILIVNAGACTEVGDGIFKYTVAGNLVTKAGNYRFVFKTADATVDQQHLASEWVVGTTWVERILGTIAAGTHNPQSGDAYSVAMLIKVVTDKISGMLQASGLLWQFTADALKLSPSAVASIAVTTADISSAVNGNALIRAGYTFRQTWDTTITDNLGSAVIIFAVKNSLSDSDNEAVILLRSDTGLTRVKGVAYATPAHGTITVTGSSGAWHVAIAIDEAATAQFLGYGKVSGILSAIKYLSGGDALPIGDNFTTKFNDGVVRATA